METITKTIKMNLYADADYGEEAKYIITAACEMEDFGYVLVGSKEIEVEIAIPESFDIVNAKIDALKAEKQKIGATAQVQMNNIEEQIQSLLAIEFNE